jgi:CPA1 family monovalent cation:H+ antiporter
LLPWSAALLLGAIVAATDPIAGTAVFRHIGAPLAVRTIVEAESIGNDGVALILYAIALTAATGGGVTWYHATGHGAVAILMGCVVGVACAIPLWLGLAATEASEYEVAGTVALAYASYLVATSFGWSGIFATASAAVALRVLIRRRPHVQHLRRVGNFWHAGAYMTNAIVFLMTGLSISVTRMAQAPLLVLAVLAAIVLVRAGLTFAAVRSRGGAAMVLAAGVRGALPLAMALALPASLPYREQIVDAVFAIVILTLVVQGGLLRWVVGLVARATPQSTEVH